MILNTMRAWTDAMQDATHGLVAQLAVITAAGYVASGDAALPTALNIGDESRDSQVAIGRPASGANQYSASIFFEALAPLDPISHFLYRDAQLSLGLRFDSTKDDMPIGVTQLAYLVRAGLLVTQWWLRDAPQDPWRVRNGINIVQGVSLQATSFTPTARTPQNTYGLRLIVQVRDNLSN